MNGLMGHQATVWSTFVTTSFAEEEGSQTGDEVVAVSEANFPLDRAGKHRRTNLQLL